MLDPLALELIDGRIHDGDTVKVAAVDDRLPLRISYNRRMSRIRSKQESIKSAILGVGRILGLPKYFLITIVRDQSPLP